MGQQYKPLPVRQLMIICACRFAEPICFTVIFPFIIFMIRDFKMTDEDHVGYYVGLITSSFAVAQLLTGIHWGMLSDRIGRRPVILVGLVGTLTSVFLFGLSKSFMWALCSRCLCGLLNGNVGVLKSMVSELTIENAPDQRARAFSMLPLMYGLGSIIGPILGGMLSNPVETHPTWFTPGSPATHFLTTYPYFLPCALSSLICTTGLIFGFFFLEETLASAKQKKKKKHHHHQQALLEQEDNHQYNTFAAASERSASPTPTLPSDKPPTLREALTPAVLSICLSYALFAFQAVFYDELFPLWTATRVSSGGLGYKSYEIGYALAYCGCITLLVQLFILPVLTKRFGMIRLFRMVLMGCIILYFCQGFVRLLYNVPNPMTGETQTKFWVWAGLLVAVTFKTLFQTTAMTSCTILINNAAPRLDTLGTINGFSQCCASGMRAFGPASCGAIWSASLGATWIPFHIRVHISWMVLSTWAILTFYTSTRLNPLDFETSKFMSREEEVVPDDEDELCRRQA